LLVSLIKGYNISVLAYGQTGSGKTFTMGTGENSLKLYERERENYRQNGHLPMKINQEIGILPRVFSEIFEKTEKISRNSKKNKLNHTFSLSLSFLEIYQEEVKDLLSIHSSNNSNNTNLSVPNTKRSSFNQGSISQMNAYISNMNNNNNNSNISNNTNNHIDPTNLQIRDDPSKGVQIIGLSLHSIQNIEQVMNILSIALMNRKTAKTNLNERSSRSHCICTLYMEQMINKVDIEY
jgi:hypothetical protein